MAKSKDVFESFYNIKFFLFKFINKKLLNLKYLNLLFLILMFIHLQNHFFKRSKIKLFDGANYIF